MRIMIFVLSALVAAGGTGFYLFRELQAPAQKPTPQAEAPKARDVFVPVAALAAGTILQPEHLGHMAMPERAIGAEMIVADADGKGFLTGSVARQMLPAGVPIARSAVVQPGDRGFLAAVLPQGKRAISIPISETAGLSGLALPGDWVDLILTYTVTAKENDGAGGEDADKPRDIHASETVARNILLLALDNRVSHTPAADAEDKLVAPPIPRTATLQVTPREAEEITLASTLGTLALALNSVRDGGEAMDARKQMTETLALDRAGGGPSLRSRKPLPDMGNLTLDADVTSLLRAEVQRTIPEQVSRIQVVRGSSRTGVATIPPASGAETPAPQAEGAAPPQP